MSRQQQTLTLFGGHCYQSKCTVLSFSRGQNSQGEPLLRGTCRRHHYDKNKTGKDNGRLAQLARASPLQGEGRGFESLNAH